MSRFRIQRVFAIVLGIITLIASFIVPVQQPSIMIGCFMVFWGFDGWIDV